MDRRKFVNNALWLSASLYGCSKSDIAAPTVARLTTNPPIDEPFTVRGKVSVSGMGIKNVVVSDGFSVVQTLDDGSYQFKILEKSKHLFVTVPSGYSFLHEKNICRHYRNITSFLGQEINFELEALRVDDAKHQFVIWADPQVLNNSDVQMLMNKSVPDVIAHKNAQPSDALIHGISVGDLVFDNFSLFSSYSAGIEKCGFPFFQAIGNHDMDFNNGAASCNNKFEQNFGPTYYSFNRGSVHYVVLGDVLYLGKSNQYKGYIPTEQLDWLRKDLSFVPKDKLLVVCLHIPISLAVDNRDDFYSIVKDYNVHVMSGHFHDNQNIIKGNVYEHVHGAVSAAWWRGPICYDGTPAGYAVYEVNGTELSWHYKSVGYSKDYQIRSNVSLVNGQKVLQSNIWNWDPEWKVEYIIDGKSKGSMPKVVDYDKLAVSLYKGDKLPSEGIWAWIEPEKTGHLFSVIIPAGVRQVIVLAIDRFGKTYESITELN